MNPDDPVSILRLRCFVGRAQMSGALMPNNQTSVIRQPWFSLNLDKKADDTPLRKRAKKSQTSL